MDGGTWWATVHRIAESDTTERLHLTSLTSPTCEFLQSRDNVTLILYPQRCPVQVLLGVGIDGYVRG